MNIAGGEHMVVGWVLRMFEEEGWGDREGWAVGGRSGRRGRRMRRRRWSVSGLQAAEPK